MIDCANGSDDLVAEQGYLRCSIDGVYAGREKMICVRVCGRNFTRMLSLR